MATTYQEEFVEAPADEQAVDLLKRLNQQTLPTAGGGGGPRSTTRPIGGSPARTGTSSSCRGRRLQAYYVSKGFHLLTPAETKEWLEVVRPLVLKEQRKRAQLITTLRRIAAKHPGVDLAGDMEITPTEELVGMVEQIKTLTGGNVAVIMGRFREDDPGPDISDVQLASG